MGAAHRLGLGVGELNAGLGERRDRIVHERLGVRLVLGQPRADPRVGLGELDDQVGGEGMRPDAVGPVAPGPAGGLRGAREDVLAARHDPDRHLGIEARLDRRPDRLRCAVGGLTRDEHLGVRTVRALLVARPTHLATSWSGVGTRAGTAGADTRVAALWSGRADLRSLPAAEAARDQVEGHRGARRGWCGCRRRWRCSGRQCSCRRRRGPCRAPRLVELGDRAGRTAHRQWTIFDSGSSMMSVAPASLRAGMSVLISALAPPSRPRSRRRRTAWTTVGDFIDGQELDHPRRGRPRPTLSFTSTLPRASSAPSSRVRSWCMAWRLSGSS